MDEQGHEKMYELICAKRFDSIDEKQDRMLDILRGKNGDPGLIDDVRTLKSRWSIIIGALVILFGALLTQVARWLFASIVK